MINKIGYTIQGFSGYDIIGNKKLARLWRGACKKLDEISEILNKGENNGREKNDK